jgi:hypothetical protein
MNTAYMIQIGGLIAGILGILTLAIITCVCFYILLFVKRKIKETNIIIFGGYNRILNSIVYDQAKALTDEDLDILLNDESKMPFVIADVMQSVLSNLSPDFIKTIDSFVSLETLVVDKLFNAIREIQNEE